MMRIRRPPAVALLAAAALLLACSDAPQEKAVFLQLPDGEAPLVDGVIEAVEGGRVLVTDSTRLDMCARGWGRLAATTRIESTRGGALAASSLRVGDRAAIWTDGPVAESCPSQFTATRLVVGR